MLTVKDLLTTHLQYTFEKEGWQPPLGAAVWGLTAAQAAWKPSPRRHSIWQIVRHLLHWKRSVLQSLSGNPPDFEELTRADWPEVTGDQAAWEADVRALHEIYIEFQRRLDALGEEGVQQKLPSYRQSRQPVPVALRLLHMFTHDIYHAGQIQYLRALQEIDHVFYSAWDGDVSGLQEALDAQPQLLNACNRDGWTALQIAAYSGRPEAVRFLLDRGADMDALAHNEIGGTALHSAIMGWQAGQRAPVVVLLLGRGADPNVTDAAGQTALQLALKEGQEEIARLLRQHGTRE